MHSGHLITLFSARDYLQQGALWQCALQFVLCVCFSVLQRVHRAPVCTYISMTCICIYIHMNTLYKRAHTYLTHGTCMGICYMSVKCHRYILVKSHTCVCTAGARRAVASSLRNHAALLLAAPDDRFLHLLHLLHCLVLCIAVSCSVCCSVLQRVAVCCRVLECIAVVSRLRYQAANLLEDRFLRVF